MSSVDRERGFSSMNLCKSDLRNRLTVQHTSQLMTIKLNGPPRCEFEFKAAFLEWAATKDRRIICHQ